jgi:hypothetical protein
MRNAVVCERCYVTLTTAQLQPTPPGVVKLRQSKAPEDPAWVRWRMQVIALMERDGSWAYMEHDRCIGLCPVCLDRTLTVRFIGHTPEADWLCANGCDAAAIVRQLGRAWL